MDPFLTNWLLLIGVFTVALASPGPDFVMALRNSILHSRQAGIYTAIGFGLGVGVHVLYCLAGLAYLISQSVVMFNIIKWLGAVYLFYVGFKALKSKGFDTPDIAEKGRVAMSPTAALRSGFITNLLNPKATLFFLALFTQILSPEIALYQKAVYGLTCIVMTMLWFSIVATILTTPKIRAAFLRFSKWIDRICGSLFIVLGVKLAVTRL